MEISTETPRRIQLVDSLFTTPSFGMAGDNAEVCPKMIEWDRTSGEAGVKVFTDACLDLAVDDPTPNKIALLIESPGMTADAYREIRNLHPHFRWVLSHDVATVKAINNECNISKAFWYPLGGCWIDESEIESTKKTKMVSIIASAKRSLAGHRMREYASGLVPEEDRYGALFGNHIESKREGLVPYRYSIVTENYRSNLYFTEKLIDCFACRTIPIYWGSGNVDTALFNGMGILHWNDIGELEEVIRLVSEEDYERRARAIESNYERCQGYKCPEDWIMKYYGFMFSEISK